MGVKIDEADEENTPHAKDTPPSHSSAYQEAPYNEETEKYSQAFPPLDSETH